LIVEEVQQRVVAEVADVRIGGESPDAGGVQAVADILIDRPAVPDLVVGDDRPATLPVIPVHR
jgi:hypothetical protein